MKKFLLILLLIAVIVSPVFSQTKGDLDFDIKAGLGFNSSFIFNGWYFSEKGNENLYAKNTNIFSSLEIEFNYYIFKNLPLGIGINHIFDSKVNEMNYNFTNIFLTNLAIYSRRLVVFVW